MADTIVLYPFLGMGHLISMVELAKLVISHFPSFSITIFVLNPPQNPDPISQQIANTSSNYIAAVSAATPITFHHFSIPTSDLPPNTPLVELNFLLPRLNNPQIRQALQTISEKSKIKAFIMDFFCDAAFEVATGLKIPAYYFFTSSGNGLGFFLHFPVLDRNTETDIKDLDAPIKIPGLPPIPTSETPPVIQTRANLVYQNFLQTAIHFSESSGIIVNTFELLEERALKAISDGLCTAENYTTPAIFAVRPVISTKNGDGDANQEKHECLSWLDKQPSGSVMFLCFGSMGVFSVKQLKEMAMALENTGQRFLWVVRTPPPKNDKSYGIIGEILDESFLERTRDRGLVVQNWAPQLAVLSHDSVGGFVTHCGWNSVLESVSCGVPMVAWPLYAEQKMNRVYLVEEMKLALAIKESEDGFVSSGELEERVRELMESENGRELRERALVMRDAAITAMKDGGSSRVALTKLADGLSKTELP
ncbi:hypothetical protein UlMin_042776 [Ulmus minor]